MDQWTANQRKALVMAQNDHIARQQGPKPYNMTSMDGTFAKSRFNKDTGQYELL